MSRRQIFFLFLDNRNVRTDDTLTCTHARIFVLLNFHTFSLIMFVLCIGFQNGIKCSHCIFRRIKKKLNFHVIRMIDS